MVLFTIRDTQFCAVCRCACPWSASSAATCRAKCASRCPRLSAAPCRASSAARCACPPIIARSAPPATLTARPLRHYRTPTARPHCRPTAESSNARGQTVNRVYMCTLKRYSILPGTNLDHLFSFFNGYSLVGKKLNFEC
jgi:hypothetical protein